MGNETDQCFWANGGKKYIKHNMTPLCMTQFHEGHILREWDSAVIRQEDRKTARIRRRGNASDGWLSNDRARPVVSYCPLCGSPSEIHVSPQSDK